MKVDEFKSKVKVGDKVHTIFTTTDCYFIVTAIGEHAFLAKYVHADKTMADETSHPFTGGWCIYKPTKLKLFCYLYAAKVYNNEDQSEVGFRRLYLEKLTDKKGFYRFPEGDCEINI